MCFLGLTLMMGSILSLAGWLLMIPVLLLRIRVEEAMLVKELGEDYVEYSRRVKRLIPGVY